MGLFFLKLPLLEAGDIIIDGGNSEYRDTQRRCKYLKEKGMFFIGSGVSGGEEGARYGPSIMPGGAPEAWYVYLYWIKKYQGVLSEVKTQKSNMVKNYKS